MDISGVSTSLNTSSMLSSSLRTQLQPLEHSKEGREVRHEHSHHGEKERGRALGVFRHELQLSLKAKFSVRFSVPQPGYAQTQGPTTADDIAAEALGAARQLVSDAPTRASESLISFRVKVHESASYVREAMGDHDDDVDSAVAKVDAGLDELEEEVGNNRESSASVLAVDTRSKQRSTIKIRTQEGDTVKLSLKRSDKLSATDVAKADGESVTTSTEVEVSSRSRMMLKVEGDLNESEFAAIQNVFAQAERIADEFFGGDIAAAFSLAEGFEFDSEQLARVNMGFKMKQESRIEYSESLRSANPLPKPAVVAVPESVPVIDVQAGNVASAPVAVPDPVVAVLSADESAPAEDTAPVPSSALSSFFDALGTFLRSVGEGFEAGPSSGSFSFHYSESFKLELLKAVIHTVAPDESGQTAANAGAVIEGVLEAEGHD